MTTALAFLTCCYLLFANYHTDVAVRHNGHTLPTAPSANTEKPMVTQPKGDHLLQQRDGTQAASRIPSRVLSWEPVDRHDTPTHTAREWGAWGPCSASCGSGNQERSRACGLNCRQVESRDCYLESCHGIMGGVGVSVAEDQPPSSSPNLPELHQHTVLDTEIDACEMWSSCEDEYLQTYMAHLSELANCPCYLPLNLSRDNHVWDPQRRRRFQWVEVNSTAEKLYVYKPEAFRCIRSMLFPGARTLAAQVCCYSADMRLVTRGRNAGTVNLISPQISWELHYKIDILPWVICKGDWTRYNQVLPPNNMLGCAANPTRRELLEQIGVLDRVHW